MIKLSCLLADYELLHELGLSKAKTDADLEATSGKLHFGEIASSLEAVGGDREALFAVLAAEKVRGTSDSSRPKQKKAITKAQVTSVMNTEQTHFQQVIAHPAIQQDPFGTLHQHLQNTIAAQRQQGTQTVNTENKRRPKNIATGRKGAGKSKKR